MCKTSPYWSWVVRANCPLACFWFSGKIGVPVKPNQVDFGNIFLISSIFSALNARWHSSTTNTICCPINFWKRLVPFFSSCFFAYFNAASSFWRVVIITTFALASANKVSLNSLALPVPTIKLFALAFPEEIPVLNSEANFVNSVVVWLSKSLRSTNMIVRSIPDFRAKSLVDTKLVNVFPEPVACHTYPDWCLFAAINKAWIACTW